MPQNESLCIEHMHLCLLCLVVVADMTDDDDDADVFTDTVDLCGPL